MPCLFLSRPFSAVNLAKICKALQNLPLYSRLWCNVRKHRLVQKMSIHKTCWVACPCRKGQSARDPLSSLLQKTSTDSRTPFISQLLTRIHKLLHDMFGCDICRMQFWLLALAKVHLVRWPRQCRPSTKNCHSNWGYHLSLGLLVISNLKTWNSKQRVWASRQAVEAAREQLCFRLLVTHDPRSRAREMCKNKEERHRCPAFPCTAPEWAVGGTVWGAKVGASRCVRHGVSDHR